MLLSSTLLSALIAATSVHGSPAPIAKRAPSPRLLYASDVAHSNSSATLDKRTSVSECQVVNVVVDALKIVSQVAYPFCSSYISIPIVTSTVTATTTATPAVVSVTDTITPASVIVTATATSTSTVLGSTTTIYSHYTPTPTPKEKRNVPISIPPYLKGFAANQISTACSCLSIPAKTTTVTTTATSTLPASTYTATITAAAPTGTVTSTSTSTVAQSSTTYPALCAPSALSIISGVLSSEGNASPNEILVSSATTDLECCVACFDSLNCLSYLFNSGTCDLFILTEGPEGDPAPADAAQAALCPVGVSTQDTLFPPGISSGTITSGFGVGPCVVEADPLL